MYEELRYLNHPLPLLALECSKLTALSDYLPELKQESTLQS